MYSKSIYPLIAYNYKQHHLIWSITTSCLYDKILAFSRLIAEILSKQGIPEPIFNGDLVYKLFRNKAYQNLYFMVI